jgi:competence protein ComEA
MLAVHSYGYLGWGSRPTRLEHGTDPGYRIDLNRADRAALLQLPGIGENLARRIEDYRAEHGGFRSVNDLTAVHGIGPTTVERLRPWVRTEDLEAEAEPAGGKPLRSPAKPGGRKEAKLTRPIDINRATAAELQQLPGIGPKRAQRIVDERRKQPFGSVEDLRRVPGIGPKILERLRPYVNLEKDAAPLRVAAADRQQEAEGR